MNKLRITICVLQIVFINSSFSQAFQWVKSVGCTNPTKKSDQIAYKASPDNNGNVYVIGTYSGIADFDPGPGIYDLPCKGGIDIFVAKYDSIGNYLWAINLGSIYDDFGYGITVDMNSNVYITGKFYGTIDFDPGAGVVNLTAPSNGTHVFIAKYDAAGNYQWAKDIGSGGGNSIICDSLSNIYVTGYIYSASNFDPGVGSAIITPAGNIDGFFAKYDNAGNYILAKNIGGDVTNHTYGKSIAIDKALNIYITGNFDATIIFNPGVGSVNYTSNGTRDIFFAKYSINGNLVWAKQIGSTGNDEGYDIATDVNNNVYLTGYFSNTADFDPDTSIANHNTNYANIFLGKYDSNGGFVWANSFGAYNEYEYGKSILVDKFGNIFLAGSYVKTVDFDPGPGVANLAGASSLDGFFAKYDNAGNYLWAKTTNSKYGTVIGHVYLYGMAMSSQKDYIYLFGAFNGRVDFNPGPGIDTLSSLYPYNWPNSQNDIFFSRFYTCNSPVEMTTSYINPSCYENNNGSITINATGGTLPYTYYVNNNSGSNPVFSNLAPNTYSIFTMDANGCYDDTIKNTLTQPTPTITFTNPTINETCTGKNDAKITIIASGGNGVYKYSIDGGFSYVDTNVFSNLASGLFQLKVKDSSNCFSIKKNIYLVTLAYSLNTSITPTNLSCAGKNDGKITTLTSGGNGAYSFNWSNGSTESNATGLSAGTYSVIVSDTLGCYVTAATNVFVNNSTVWSQKADFGGTAKYAAVGFSIGAKGYITTGKTSSSYTNDLWEYDSVTDKWSQKANFPGASRFGASCFVVNGKAYVGTGSNGFTIYNDLWEYDPSNDTWTQKADFPGIKRKAAVGFAIGSMGYIGTGDNGSVYFNDVWEYDPLNDNWTQKANFGGAARDGAISFTIGSKAYVGTGYNGTYLKDMWEFDPVVNSWTQKSGFAGTARCGSVGLTIDGKGYLAAGIDNTLNYKRDFWQYDANTDSWSQKENFAGNIRYIPVGFSIGNLGYVGTGFVNNSLYKKDFWEYAPLQDKVTTSITQTDPICYGTCNGGLNVVASGGTFTYSWNNGETTSTINNLCPGKYLVKVTDSTTCYKTDSIIITQLTPITHPQIAFSNDSLICSVPSMYNYEWFVDSSGYYVPISNCNGSQFCICQGKNNVYVTIYNIEGCSDSSSVYSTTNCTTLSSNTLEMLHTLDFLISPSLIQNQFTIETPSTIEVGKPLIKIIDLNGKIMLEQILQTSNVIINCENLISGIYNANITWNDQVINKKLVVIK